MPAGGHHEDRRAITSGVGVDGSAAVRAAAVAAPPAVSALSPDTSTTATLLDGAAVTIRRLGRCDRDDIAGLAAALDERERYLRFFTAQPTYLGDWIESLVDTSPGRFARGRIAIVNGQTRLIADVLAENHLMLRVLNDSGWRCDRHLDGTVVTVEVISVTSMSPQSRGDPSSHDATSRTGRRGADGSGSALTGAHPRRSSIWGNALAPNTSI